MKTQLAGDGTILNAAVLTAIEVVHRRVLCPACMEKVFERWPEGWDAHAAHSCMGLEPGSHEERKAEFRRTLGHLFRDGGLLRKSSADLDSLVEFVRGLQTQQLFTATQNRAFTVSVTPKGFVYTPEATRKQRLHRYPRIQLYLDQYTASESLDPRFYHKGSNQSYILAILGRFHSRRAAGGPCDA